MSEGKILLSEQPNVKFWAYKGWLNVEPKFRYLGNAREISESEVFCGFICEEHGDGYKDYLHGEKELTPAQSFETLLSSLGIQPTGDWNIYKEIL